MSNTIIHDTIFWSERFFEHFHFLAIFIEKNWHKLEEHTHSDVRSFLLEPVYQLEKEWYRQVSEWSELEQDENRDRDRDEKESKIEYLKLKIIPWSIRVYKEIENAFRASKIACIPDLLEHMIEETQYFYKYILEHDSDLLSEIAWWSKEHAENIDFISCELPRMAKFNLLHWGNVPEIVKMLYDNNKLARHFESLNEEANHLLGVVEYDGQNISDNVEWKIEGLYHAMITAKIKHFDAIKLLLSKLNELPLSNEDRLIVTDLLNHEEKEAIFAYNRIENFYYSHKY
jgi:hypothetical protein